jgi:DNA transformation protein
VAVSPAVIEQVRELLSELGTLRVRPMFGGAGVYAEDLFFALIVGENLYLKVDDETEAAFASAGSAPFVYGVKDGTEMIMRYWLLPEAALDDPGSAADWARMALAAAMRARKPKTGKGKPGQRATRADIGSGPWDG